MVQKLKFKYCNRRPSWIYANRKSCPKLQFRQPNGIFSRTPCQCKSIKKLLIWKHISWLSPRCMEPQIWPLFDLDFTATSWPWPANGKITPETDSAHPKLSEKRYYTLFYDEWFKNWISNSVTGGQLGFMQIKKFAQSCRLGNQATFVQGPHASTNPSKNFIGKTFLAFQQIKSTILSSLLIILLLSWI